jgi:hypothetical protein
MYKKAIYSLTNLKPPQYIEIKNKIAKYKKKVEEENKPKTVPKYAKVHMIRNCQCFSDNSLIFSSCLSVFAGIYSKPHLGEPSRNAKRGHGRFLGCKR